MGVFDEPKIDGHCHVLDPRRFPYAAGVPYRPAGQEVGDAHYFQHVMDAYGVRHALLVGPNSGYGEDNRCLLDALEHGRGRFKGVAVVPASADTGLLQALQTRGVVGVAFNPALHGLDHYADIDPLLHRLRDLGLWAQFQVHGDQLGVLRPRIEAAGVRALIDHCGRPVLGDGLHAPGFQALLEMGRTARRACESEGGPMRAAVKISGFAKFSVAGYPFDDVHGHVQALLEAFGSRGCLWASDWPFLRAEPRLDIGPLLTLAERWFDAGLRRRMMWDTPRELFGW